MSPCPARARTTAKYAKPRSNRPIGSGLGGLLPRRWRVEKLGEEELDAQTAAGIVADCVRDGHHQAKSEYQYYEFLALDKSLTD